MVLEGAGVVTSKSIWACPWKNIVSKQCIWCFLRSENRTTSCVLHIALAVYEGGQSQPSRFPGRRIPTGDLIPRLNLTGTARTRRTGQLVPVLLLFIWRWRSGFLVIIAFSCPRSRPPLRITINVIGEALLCAP